MRLVYVLIWFSLEFTNCRLSEELCDCKDIKDGRTSLFNSSDADKNDLRFLVGIFGWTTNKTEMDAKKAMKTYTSICDGTVLNARFILTTSNFRYPLSANGAPNFIFLELF